MKEPKTKHLQQLTCCLQKNILFVMLLFSITLTYAQSPFNSNNIVVMQVGDGTVQPNGIANPGAIVEFTTVGSLVFSHTIPSAGAGRLTFNPSIREGQITRSADFRQIVIPGFDAPVGYANVSQTTGLVNPRAIGVMDCSGSYARPLSSPTFFSQGNFNSATANGSDYWGAGGGNVNATNGINYFGTGAASNVTTSTQNTRFVSIFNGQLYFSTQDIPMGIYTVGSGTPTTSGQTTTIEVPLPSNSSPFAFAFNSTTDICYIADDHVDGTGGIQKWVKSAGVWSLAYTLSTGASMGARGLTVDFSGANPVLYATTATTTNFVSNQLIKITDTGVGSPVNVLATSPTNSFYRGVAFAPCTPPIATASSSSHLVCPNTTVSLFSNAVVCSDANYSWSNGATTLSTIVTVSTTTTYTVVVSNGCGSSTSSVTVVVHDSLAPVITCPADVVVCNYPTECQGAAFPNSATATDDCNGPITIVGLRSDSVVLGSTNNYPVGVTTITWTATDESGNSSSCTSTVTVNDCEDPVISCPNNLTIDCTADNTPMATGSATATDNCGVQSVSSTDSVIAGNCAGNYTILRTWTATDVHNNTSSCVQTLTVSDTDGPMLSGVPANTSADCGSVPPPATVTAADDCSGGGNSVSGVIDNNDIIWTFYGFPVVYDLYTFTVSTSGNYDFSQMVNINQGTPNIGGFYFFAGNFNPNNSASSAFYGSYANNYTLPLNAGTTYQVLIIQGYLSTANSGNLFSANYSLTIVPSMGNPGFASFGSNVVLTETTTTGNCAGNYILHRTWTATDNCGNSTSATQNITVSDTNGPIITCPANASVDCTADNSSAATGTATATDDCSGVASMTQSDAITAGNCAGNYTISRTWIATDSCGNSSSCVQTITVTDTHAPVISCPADASVDCSADNTSAATGTATATDDCSGVASITQSDAIAPGNCAGNYVITRTWTATDSCGNSSSCVQTITVTDTHAPVIACPAAASVDCSADNTSAATGTATAMDDCSGVASITQSDAIATGNCAGNYVISRTWTATDGCGNSSSCVQTITVTDTHAPIITCPSDVARDCAADNTSAATGTATAIDDCSGVASIIESDSIIAGNCSSNYVIIRTWTATDNCGNSSSCVQTITVTDTHAPTLTLNAAGGPLTGLGSMNTYYPTVPGSPNGGVTHGHGIAYDTDRNTLWVTDNEGLSYVREFAATQPNFSVLPQLSSFFVAGLSSEIEGIAFDATDNTLWIIDNSGTVVHYNRSGVALPGGFNVFIGGTFGIALQDNYFWIDNGTNVYKYNKVGGAYAGVNFFVGQLTVSYDPERDLLWTSPWNDSRIRAFDLSGNLVFTSPVIPFPCIGHDIAAGAGRLWMVSESCTPDQVYSLEIIGGAIDEIVECGSVYVDPGYVVSDDCDSATVIVTGSVNTSIPGVYNITYVATDGCNNSDTIVRTVTVLDRVAPFWLTQPGPNMTVDCDSLVVFTPPTASDACTMATVNVISDITTPGGPCPGSYSRTIIWDATDLAGNHSVQVSQTITMNDCSAPMITCPQNITTCNDQGQCGAHINPGIATATDNCGIATIIGVRSDSVPFTNGTCVSHSYNLNGTYADAFGGPSLVPNGGTLGASNYAFGALQGLQISNAVSLNNYSIQVKFTPDNVFGYRKIIDFKNRTSDDGLYIFNGALNFYNVVTGPAGVFVPGVPVCVLLTRNGVTNEINAYVNGVLQFSFVDAFNFGTFSEPGNIMHLLQDDFAFVGEDMTGVLDDLQIFNCPLSSMEASTACNSASGNYPVGTTTITWTATDVHGNTSTCTQTITVNDCEDPVITCGGPVTINSANGTCCLILTAADGVGATATDNCGIQSITSDHTGCYTSGTTIVTWTATDINGRTSTCTQSVTLVCCQDAASYDTVTTCPTYTWNGMTYSASGDYSAGPFPIPGGCDSMAYLHLTITPPQILTPGPIGGPLSQCVTMFSGSSTYTVPAIPDAVSYIWTLPNGVTIASGQGTNTLVVNWWFSLAAKGVQGPICVTVTTPCGSGQTCSYLDISAIAPVTPSSISGPAKLCPGDIAVYSISTVSRASSYHWTLPPNIIPLSGLNSNVVTVQAGPMWAGGNLSVKAINACGSSPERNKYLTPNFPTVPGVISGPTAGVCGLSNMIYSIAPVANATGYTWAVPSGVTLNSGQGTASINVSFPANYAGGSITVYSTNACGSSALRSLSIVGAPATPGVITGPATVCTGSTNHYSIATVTNTSSYTWTAPGSIIAGQGTKEIDVTYGSSPATNQIITVKATNACGTSGLRLLNGVAIVFCPRIGNATAANGVQVYPNPTHGNVTIEIPATEEGIANVNVMDLSGRNVKAINYNVLTGNNIFDLSLDGVSEGVYMVRIVNNGFETITRLIVE
jgi:PKD-like domain/Domain of unknown function (DUF5011)/Secretion system C-terminal sorting domain/HYR domain